MKEIMWKPRIVRLHPISERKWNYKDQDAVRFVHEICDYPWMWNDQDNQWQVDSIYDVLFLHFQAAWPMFMWFGYFVFFDKFNWSLESQIYSLRIPWIKTIQIWKNIYFFSSNFALPTLWQIGVQRITIRSAVSGNKLIFQGTG